MVGPPFSRALTTVTVVEARQNRVRESGGAGDGPHRVDGDGHAVGAPRERHQDRYVDAGVDIAPHEGVDLAGRAHEVDAVDHAVADRLHRTVTVAGGVPLAYVGHLVA